MPAGRPSIYTKELATEICKRISEGESLRNICNEDGMPDRTTVHDWLLDENKKEFSNQYALACNIRAENMFDDLLDIADDGTNDYMERENKDGSTYEALNAEAIGRSRLRVDTRKWYLSKVLPKKFGDKIDLTTGGESFNESMKDIDDATLQNYAAGSESRTGKKGTRKKASD